MFCLVIFFSQSRSYSVPNCYVMIETDLNANFSINIPFDECVEKTSEKEMSESINAVSPLCIQFRGSNYRKFCFSFIPTELIGPTFLLLK